MDEIVRLVEDKEYNFETPISIEGLPDVGLVGAIAASHIVEELELEEIAHLESEQFPPIMVIHKGMPKDPVRIYGNRNLIVLASEIPLPINTIAPAVRILSKWFRDKGVRMEVSLSGIPVQNRVDISQPKVYSVVNSIESKNKLKSMGIEVMEEGFIAGIYALILRELTRIKLPAIALLAESFLKYPDPGAAASVIESLNKIIGTKIAVKSLLEKGDEIKVKARDLMMQSQGVINDMQKPVEQSIPIMYR
jgi:uncharacterized protein